MINPSQRGTAIDGPATGGEYGIAVGNKGKDEIHGSDSIRDIIFGDARYGLTEAPTVFYGDDDVIFGYAGADLIRGGAGDDFIDAGDDAD